MESKTKKNVVVMLILFTILQWLVNFFYHYNQFKLNEKFGKWAYTAVSFMYLPAFIVVVIVFIDFMRRNQKKTILWSILWTVLVIINSKVAIIVFLLFFLDGKFTTGENKQRPNDDGKILENDK